MTQPCNKFTSILNVAPAFFGFVLTLMAFPVLDQPAVGDDSPRPRRSKTRTEQQTEPTDADSEEAHEADTDKQAIQELELFEAIKKDMIGILVVPRDFSVLKMSVRNKTDKPLIIHPPEVFSAIPEYRVRQYEAAQSLGMNGTNNAGSMGGGYGMQPSQGLGGSFYMADSLAYSQRKRQRNTKEKKPEKKDVEPEDRSQGKLLTWKLAPGRVVSQLFPCFCLEFGVPDPNPRVPYLLRPLDDLTKDTAVRELLIRFNRRQLPQRVTQLAIWHAANHVPWQTLAKVRLPRSIAGRNVSFTMKELQAARLLVESLPEYRQRFQGPSMR